MLFHGTVDKLPITHHVLLDLIIFFLSAQNSFNIDYYTHAINFSKISLMSDDWGRRERLMRLGQEEVTMGFGEWNEKH